MTADVDTNAAIEVRNIVEIKVYMLTMYNVLMDIDIDVDGDSLIQMQIRDMLRQVKVAPFDLIKYSYYSIMLCPSSLWQWPSTIKSSYMWYLYYQIIGWVCRKVGRFRSLPISTALCDNKLLLLY